MSTRTKLQLALALSIGAMVWLASPAAAADTRAAQKCVSNCECPPGQNCSPRTGTCSPVLCPQIYLPVCGLDGKTYPNACTADASHVVIAHTGPCEKECGGIIGKPCDKGQFCQQPTGQCIIADGTGTCAPIPQICTFIYKPVCGCDGKTYGNDCARQAAGVSKLWDGPCRETADEKSLNYSTLPKSCATNAQCGNDELCYKPDGQCDDDNGRCRHRPELCPDLYKPVCGCNGVTYSNTCFARMAGTNVRHNGKCGEPETEVKEGHGAPED
ncbi:MAG TPA: Kazal-type serine protease inhibitor domain-containing protein [Thermoanaerobaculia bacterium]|nr:Kazal-type serine protease inhibitor domain-containing protein [Thermoanaerobaculia bacterium]